MRIGLAAVAARRFSPLSIIRLQNVWMLRTRLRVLGTNRHPTVTEPFGLDKSGAGNFHAGAGLAMKASVLRYESAGQNGLNVMNFQAAKYNITD